MTIPTIHETDGTIIIQKTSISAAGKSLLQELTDMNRCAITEETYELSIDVFYSLKNDLFIEDSEAHDVEGAYNGSSDQLLTALGFPEYIDKSILLDQKGTIGYASFSLSASYAGKRVTSHGPFLVESGSGIVFGTMPFELYEFFLALHNIEKAGNSNEQMRRQRRVLARAQRLSESGIAELSKYAKTNKFIEVEGPLHLAIDQENTEFKIVPEIDADEDAWDLQIQFKTEFDRRRNGESEYKLTEKTEDGKSQYLILDEDIQPDLQSVKILNDKIKDDPKLLHEVIQNPEKFFDPERVDLDEFSQRVAGIGIFKPIKVPYMATADVDWWGRVVFSDSGEDDIEWLDDTLAEKLEEKITQAREQEDGYIEWDEKKIPLDDAEKRLDEYQQIKTEYERTKESADQQPTKNEKFDVIAKHNIESVEYDEQIRLDELKRLEFRALPTDTTLETLVLKSYQKTGIAWLQSMKDSDAKGVLLADDMGLGKTLQVLYFLEWYQQVGSPQKKEALKILLVSPKSLIQNWADEYRKFFPNGELEFFPNESLAKFQEMLDRFGSKVPGMVHQCTYQTLTRNSLPYAKVDWDIVVTDEAQNAKTPGNRITNALLALKAGFKIAMTGTPVENSFQELWNIVEYLNPGYLGSLKEFNQRYGTSGDIEAEELNDLANELRKRIDPILLRRTKAEVLSEELPEKYIHDGAIDNDPSLNIEIHLTPSQEDIYTQVRSRVQAGLARGKVLGEIQKLKIAHDHPRFLNPQERLNAANFDEVMAKESAKIDALERILDRVHARSEKALLFADHRFTQYFLQNWISNKYNYAPKIINGDSPVTSRHRRTSYSQRVEDEDLNLSRLDITRQFNKQVGFGVLILSPIAAGVGLNITGANHVIHFSRHWNPAKEDQATDRAYRIGQERPVHVYLPKAVHPNFNTFDVNIAKILDRKRRMATATLYPSNFDDRESDLYIFVDFKT
jgi:SNF2 family DNA or RNA helicase